MGGVITPSYKTGFAAPGRRELAYPNLWRGCVGAWSMGLGATGSVLRDWSSSRGTFGTLTSMDPGTDWIVNGNQLSLDFDATNDYVLNSSFRGLSAYPLTLCGWGNSAGAGALRTLVSIGSEANVNNYINLGRNTAGVGWCGSRGASLVEINAGTITTGLWYHYAATFDSLNAVTTLYLNGIQMATAGAPIVPTDMLSFNIGRTVTRGFFWYGGIDDVRIYNRILSQLEIATLALRRGISYETIRNRVAKAALVGGTFKAAWARKPAQIIGGR